MNWALAFLTTLLANAGQASVSGLACTISGSNIMNSIDLSERNVGTATPVTLTAILKEDADKGTFVTYVKLNIKYSPKSPAPLELTTVTSAGEVLAVEFTAAHAAYVKIASRAGNEAMILKLNCTEENFSYLLNPAYDQEQDPFNAFQNAAFTLPKLLLDLLYGVYYHSPTASESEFLAEHFCSEGDAVALLNDLQNSNNYPNLWPVSSLGDSNLMPKNLRLENSTVRWEQPQETATCIRSHIAEGIDEDGVPYAIEVCDEYRVDQLEPLNLEIKTCE